MREMGWFDKPNVKILEGKWQDFVSSKELLGVGGFDAVYTDTFSENYEGMAAQCYGVVCILCLIGGDEMMGRFTTVLWSGPEAVGWATISIQLFQRIGRH